MLLAKQSTAKTVIVGPILDSTGAEYTTAVIGDLSLSKNGGTLTALAAAATLTHIANGQYTLVLTTGNTDTLGTAEISCNKSTYQMPQKEFMVIPQTVYDALVANATNTTGGLPAATGSISALAGAISVYAGADTSGTTTLLSRLSAARAGYLDFINNSNLANVPAFPTNFSSLGIAVSGKLNGVILVDTTTTNTDMITQANVRTAVGLGSANLDSQLSGINSKTTNLPSDPASETNATANKNAVLTRLGTPAGASVSADIAAAKADTSTILSRIGAFTGTGVNTILGVLKAMFSKSASTPSDVGGTADAATDSLEALRDRGDSGAWGGTGSSVAVQPLQSTITDRVSATTIQAYYNETGWTIGPVVVVDGNNDPVNLTVYTTLKLIIEDQHGTDLLATTSVTVSGTDNNQWTATGTSAVTATVPSRHKWALRGLGTGVNVVIGRGDVIVSPAAEVDA